MSFRAIVLGAALGVLAAFVPSCGGSTCNATNCSTGCCDSMGRCQPGTTPSSCGKGGVTCGMCAPGQACTMQICGGLMGGGGSAGGGFTSGGGSAGGSAGGAADSGTMCTDYGDIDFGTDTFPGGFTVGDPDGGLAGFEWWSSELGVEAPMMRTDFFVAELYFETDTGPPTLPHAGNLPVNTTNASCNECFYAYLGCDDQGENCAGEYLATSGRYEFTTATRNEAAGQFIGTGTNLTFRKWNFTSDRPSGTECITVPRFQFRSVWPEPVADGGMSADAGMTPDAGSSDAGTSDAGAADAGRDGG